MAVMSAEPSLQDGSDVPLRWSEDNTPASEEPVEEVVRVHHQHRRLPQPLVLPSPVTTVGYGVDLSTFTTMGSPMFGRNEGPNFVRRRRVTRTDDGTLGNDSAGPGVPRTVNLYEFACARPSSSCPNPPTTDTHHIGEDGCIFFGYSAFDKTSSSPVENWTEGGMVVEEEEMDCEDDTSIESERDGQEHTSDTVIMETSDDGLLLLEPKVESPDSAQLELPSLSSSSASPKVAKRPRGRPRKHPVQVQNCSSKVQKGRSKTGCVTCRKRKKKCDEAKPRCMNCEKNAVVCEGYPERTIWRSGKEKAEEGMELLRGARTLTGQKLIISTAQSRKLSIPTIQLQPVIHGVETAVDRIFFEHYVFRLSAVLTVEGPVNNAFKDMLLPLAVEHLGLMHSILALSSSNIDFDAPYGKELLKKFPEIDEKAIQKRAEYHQDEAMKEFQMDINRQQTGAVENRILSARFGQMICLIVQNLAEGRSTGEHRIHLQAYQRLINESPPKEGPFLVFIKEYFQFHIFADDLIYLPQGLGRLGDALENWNLPPVVQPEAIRLLGVQDGLFFYMSKITSIRNTIRDNMARGLEPVVDYTTLYRAAEIDAGIREWTQSWPEGDNQNRDIAGLLYKQMIWVYLWRTIYPPKSSAWVPDARITHAVNDGLALLELFPKNDPSQTLLLAPTFLIGCAAFEEEQRAPIRECIKTVKAYTGLKNADRASEVLEEVWKYMDKKDERSWDWQSIAHSMGRDFLAT